ncbi:MAG: CRISPR-associated protein Cas4 [Peptostreptococcus sp.]|uniref:CRISPR-associated protein Cas4 n=1 Tax=Peptostreptococcus sp. TaxID=1262 RepID=UPI002FC958FC
MKKEITGIMVYYYVVCKRKLWYFNNGLSMEHTNEDVAIGKAIDEECYYDEEKHINIRNIINIDYIKDKNVIHEVKKSKIVEEASIQQIKYYLWFLEKEGVENVTGILDYPLIREIKKIKLVDEDRVNIEKILEEINKIIELEIPPNMCKKKICKNCAYHDICFI